MTFAPVDVSLDMARPDRNSGEVLPQPRADP